MGNTLIIYYKLPYEIQYIIADYVEYDQLKIIMEYIQLKPLYNYISDKVDVYNSWNETDIRDIIRCSNLEALTWKDIRHSEILRTLHKFIRLTPSEIWNARYPIGYDNTAMLVLALTESTDDIIIYLLNNITLMRHWSTWDEILYLLPGHNIEIVKLFFEKFPDSTSFLNLSLPNLVDKLE